MKKFLSVVSTILFWAVIGALLFLYSYWAMHQKMPGFYFLWLIVNAVFLRLLESTTKLDLLVDVSFLLALNLVAFLCGSLLYIFIGINIPAPVVIFTGYGIIALLFACYRVKVWSRKKKT